VWIPVLVALAVRPAGGGPWSLAGCVAAAAASFVVLWRLLGCNTAADRVTAGRLLAMCAGTAGIALARGVTWIAFVVIALAVLADAADGWVARRRGATAAGASLDMEADQLTVLLLSAAAATMGLVGAWVLLLPGYRYAYVLILSALGMPVHDPDPRGDNRRGRIVCALTVTSLLLVLFPATPAPVRPIAALIAVVALGWSFMSDAVHLATRRAGVSEPA
jgi:phosphatidylglycerophosphate synthase